MTAKVHLKSPEEIARIREGGRKLDQAAKPVLKAVQEGISLAELDALAWENLEKTGGKPAFARVPGYQWATCINVNEGVVHGIPGDYRLRLGDVVSVDIGLWYQGWNTDMSTTVQVTKNGFVTCQLQGGQAVPPDEIQQFLHTGKTALKRAIAAAQAGNRVGHISEAMQVVVEAAGYTCLRNLTGHGVGKELHESPPVPCFLQGEVEATPLLKSGMVLAIEVIYTMGRPETETDPADGWTIKMKDGKMAAVFEKTIAITDDGPLICT